MIALNRSIFEAAFTITFSSSIVLGTFPPVGVGSFYLGSLLFALFAELLTVESDDFRT